MNRFSLWAIGAALAPALLASLPLVLATSTCHAEAPRDDVTANATTIPAKLVGVWLMTKPEVDGLTVEFTISGKIKAQTSTQSVQSSFTVTGNIIRATRKKKDAETEVDSVKIRKLTDRELVLEVKDGDIIEFKRR